MDNTYQIAVASSDGIVVNQHFGHAVTFYIYHVKENVLCEGRMVRQMKAVCHTGDHDDNQLRENMKKLQDCKYLLVSRIGYGAAMQAEQLGIIPVELPGGIEESIQKVISYAQVQNLFERN